MKRISLLILSLLFFATAFQSDKLLTSGWYIQSFPNMNGSSITSITFLDSLTGCAVTNTNSSLQAYILKTTNGGDNWNIVYTYTPVASSISFNKIAFATDSIGFATVNYYPCFKTTNAGSNWFIVGNAAWGADDLAVINKDTLLSVNSSGLGGGVYRSTNGGASWQIIWGGVGSGMPSRIYMLDMNYGFCWKDQTSSYFRKTTNGGLNWNLLPPKAFNDIKFSDTTNGWIATGYIQHTTNGGLNWSLQQLPNDPRIIVNGINSLSIVPNSNTIWGVYGTAFINNIFYGIIYKTTNGGLNWGFQLTDTSIHIGHYDYIQFINDKIGWAYSNYGGIHTTTGGSDTTYITSIKHVPNIVPEKYSLGQNYPNPFNPTTNIPFELKEPSHVTLKVFDARGREVKELVNGRWGTGKFIADFDASALATGIYFYQIIISGESTHQTFTETKKMMVLK